MAEALLDANVMLRYLTDEPRALADRTSRILEAAEARRIRLVVAPLTVAEVVFVLDSVYGWRRREIAERLLSLISASLMMFLDEEAITRALMWYRDLGAVHFADAYVAALAIDRASPLVSFDRGVRRIPGLAVVESPEDL